MRKDHRTNDIGNEISGPLIVPERLHSNLTPLRVAIVTIKQVGCDMIVPIPIDRGVDPHNILHKTLDGKLYLRLLPALHLQ